MFCLRIDFCDSLNFLYAVDAYKWKGDKLLKISAAQSKCYFLIVYSYGAGLLGSLAYMRMLGNSVDAIKTEGPRRLIKYSFF